MKKFKIIFTILAVLWTAFIFYNSLKTGVESASQSSGISGSVGEIIESVTNREPDMSLVTLLVRKTGHFTEYALLGLLWAITLLLYLKKYWVIILTSASICLAVSILDEFVVQANTEGRGPSFIDVLIDTTGAFLFIGLVFVGHYFFIKKKIKKEENQE